MGHSVYVWVYSYTFYKPTHLHFMSLLIYIVWAHSYTMYEPTHVHCVSLLIHCIHCMSLLIYIVWNYSYTLHEPTHIHYISIFLYIVWSYPYALYERTHIHCMSLVIYTVWAYSPKMAYVVSVVPAYRMEIGWVPCIRETSRWPCVSRRWWLDLERRRTRSTRWTPSGHRRRCL